MKTLTFISGDLQTNDLGNTYAILIGLTYADHDTIENVFIKGTLGLSNGVNNNFHSMFVKRNVRVHSETIASLGDQPERRSINKTMMENSLFISRFCHSSNEKKIANHVPPRVECLQCTRTIKYVDKSVINCENVLIGTS